jgi:hypothetical protein
MVGNSLLDEFEGIKLFDEHLLENSDKIKLKMKQSNLFETPQPMGETFLKERKLLLKEFFNPLNSYKKSEIKEEIENKEWELIKYTLTENGNINKWKEIEKYRKQNKKPYFLWKLEFAEVFQEKGGFDIVIGNPPYVGFHKVPDKEILKKKYYSANGKYDFYVVFIEKAILLNNNNGVTSFICPSYFYKRNYGKNIRQYILENTRLKLLIDFSDSQIFDTAQTYTCIFMTEKNKENSKSSTIIINNSLDYRLKFEKSQNTLKEPRWEILEENEETITTKVKNKSNLKLEHITNSISQGIVTGNNNVFLISKEKIKEYEMNYNFLKKAYKGKDISGKLLSTNYYLFYPYIALNNKKNQLISEEVIENKNPNLLKYLKDNKEILGNRDYFNKSSKKWYELWNPRKAIHFENRKFVFSEIGNKNDFVLVDECFYTDSACGFELLEKYKDYEENIYCFLNSKLASYIYKQISVPKANGYMIYKNAFLKDFPIYISDEIKKIVKSENVDELIYDLYELTEEEKEIVRNFGK